MSLKTDHYAVIRLTVQSFSSEGQIWGDITIETQYEQMSIPVQFKIAQGKLEIGPDRLVFDQCFPVSKFSFNIVSAKKIVFRAKFVRIQSKYIHHLMSQ